MKIILTLAVTTLFLKQTFAEDVYSEQFQTIQNIELVEIGVNEHGEETETLISNLASPKFIDNFKTTKYNQNNKGDITSVIMVTKELIALGKEIYKIVEAGKPVVTLQSEPVEILPRDENGVAISAMQLTGWKAPIIKKYRVQTKNYLGMKPASFDFMLIFSYGGQNNGSGRFITGAQIKPTNVNVKWGYKLDATFKVQSIMNQGTAKNPIASAVLMIDYKISTVLQNRTDNKTFFINGLGQVKAY